ncbi:cytochrome c6 [Nostoc sp. PCC 7120 = FACHB-418]|nr:cytochrome c6 [Nostoc sp. PCC 7120 = FACHB-418]BAY69872.1 cytochrome c6 [Trichormus variabilis NIES-23]
MTAAQLKIIEDDIGLNEPYLQRERDMKKIFSLVLLGIALFTFAFSSPALAADSVNGAKIFSANCASCHAGGKNLVQAQKTLKKADLEKYGMYSAEAIIAQVTNGKNAMPAFKGRLKPEQIEDVAAYVLGKADADWK